MSRQRVQSVGGTRGNGVGDKSAPEPIRTAKSHLHLDEVDYGNLSIDEVHQLAERLLPHLVQCALCRADVKSILTSIGAPPDHPLAEVLRTAENDAAWNSAAAVASSTAKANLMEQGIGYVYDRDGITYRRLPNGSEEIIHVAAVPTP